MTLVQGWITNWAKWPPNSLKTLKVSGSLCVSCFCLIWLIVYFQQQVNDRLVTRRAAVESYSLHSLMWKITLPAQPVLFCMCTQKYHSDHCLPAKASSDICCHSWFLKVSHSLPQSLRLWASEGPCTQHSFSSRWKVNKHAHLDIWSSIYIADGRQLGYFPLGLTLFLFFCLWFVHFIFTCWSSFNKSPLFRALPKLTSEYM